MANSNETRRSSQTKQTTRTRQKRRPREEQASPQARRPRKTETEGRAQTGTREGKGPERKRRRRSPQHTATPDQARTSQSRSSKGKAGQTKPSNDRASKARSSQAEPSRQRRPKRKRALSREQAARARKLSSCRIAGVVATGVLLAFSAVVGLLFFARPTTSEVEKRTLAAFPAPTWESVTTGSFFSDVALWYSDTYPLREQMVAADQALDGLHGIKTETQMVGGTKQADELPPTDSVPSSDSSNSDAKDKTDSKTEKKKDEGPVEVPTEEEVAAAVQNQITDGLYVKGDTAYNMYYFSQDAVQEYADAMNTLADEFDGQATVYSVIVPTSAAVMLPDEEANSLGGTNQVDAIKYYYSLYNDKVHGVDAIGYLRKHTDEYLYYRTDHHWTTLGSYYGYEAFCDEKGIEPEDRNKMKYKNMGDFLGSFYGQLNSEEMAANPDYMDAWYPNATNELTLYDTDGSAEKYPIIQDTSSADAFGKDLTHIVGDQPLEKIENPELSDGSSCLVIKDSFGDPFVPWLVDHYQTVWVADFRYFEGSYKDLVKENDIKDIIVVNSISLAGGGVVAPSILGKM